MVWNVEMPPEKVHWAIFPVLFLISPRLPHPFHTTIRLLAAAPGNGPELVVFHRDGSRPYPKGWPLHAIFLTMAAGQTAKMTKHSRAPCRLERTHCHMASLQTNLERLKVVLQNAL